VSRTWTSFLKFVAYLGSILEALPILDVIFQVFAYLGIILEVCRDIQMNENGSLIFGHDGIYRTFKVYSYSYVYLMQMNVKAEKTCQIIEKASGKYVFRGSTSFHSC